MKKFLSVFFSGCAIGCCAAIQPAVTFRFDDNQTVEIWESLATVFRKHNARFSFSLIPLLHGAPGNVQWCKKVCQLAEEGFEVMDHTPQHTTITVKFAPDDPKLKKLAKEQFVDHINNGKVCLKYSIGRTRTGEPFKIRIFDKNKVSSERKIAARMLIEVDGKHYYLKPAGKKDLLKMVTIWNEDSVDLPDGEKTVRQCFETQVVLDDAGYAFLLETSQAAFRKIGLKKMPQVWIQPGGYYPHLDVASFSRILRKYNYVSASCQQNGSMKGFADPEISDRCFSMLWGDFNLGKLNLQLAQTLIADTIACRRTAICSSHVTPARHGKLKEYCSMYDRILPWLAANNIKVMTQSELAAYLSNVKVDPKENVMPSLARDLDQNNVPDGYKFNRASSWQKNGSSALLKGTGNLLQVNMLCGLPRGKVRFTMEIRGNFAGKIKFALIDSLKKSCGQAILPVKVQNKNWQKCELTFDIPANCAALNFAVTAENTAQCSLRNLVLTGIDK